MRTRGLTLVATGLLAATAAPGPGKARVVRFEVEQILPPSSWIDTRTSLPPKAKP